MSDLKDAEVAIRSLLARIHGDGGHYTNEHGLEKSARDAEEIIIQFQAAQGFIHADG